MFSLWYIPGLLCDILTGWNPLHIMQGWKILRRRCKDCYGSDIKCGCLLPSPRCCPSRLKAWGKQLTKIIITSDHVTFDFFTVWMQFFSLHLMWNVAFCSCIKKFNNYCRSFSLSFLFLFFFFLPCGWDGASINKIAHCHFP
jgi:hypothetical protein